MAVYYATKSYVLHFSEAVAAEVRGTGVTVTAVCPGWTATRFQERANLQNSSLVVRFLTMDSSTVARIAVDAMLQGKSLVIPGFRNAAIAWLVRFLPREFVTGFGRRMQGRSAQ